MKRPLMVTALVVGLSANAGVGAEGYLPAPCENLDFPPPAAYECPTPYVELVPDGTDDIYERNYECLETEMRLGVVADGTGGCGSSTGIPGWSVPAELPDQAMISGSLQCHVEDWRYWHVPAMRTLGVEGVTSCGEGEIRLRAYEGDQFVGIADGFIHGHTFTVHIFAIHEKPDHLAIKYTIGARL